MPTLSLQLNNHLKINVHNERGSRNCRKSANPSLKLYNEEVAFKLKTQFT